MLESILVFLIPLALALPVLAFYIKTRFKHYRYKMKSSVLFSILSVSNFWDEASKANKKFNDKKVGLALLAYKCWWFSILSILVVYIIFG